MKTLVSTVSVVILSMTCFGQANLNMRWLREPDRLVDGYRVNLRPLANWWSNAVVAIKKTKSSEKPLPQLPDRPLKAWHRITASDWKDWQGKWILTAMIEEAPGKSNLVKILLKHPPIKEKLEHEQLAISIADLRKRRDSARISASMRADAAREANAKSSLLNTIKSAQPYSNPNLQNRIDSLSRQGTDYYRSSKAALNDVQDFDAAINMMSGRFVELPSVNDKYFLDIFAMRTGEVIEGMQVFELGLFLKPVPK